MVNNNINNTDNPKAVTTSVTGSSPKPVTFADCYRRLKAACKVKTDTALSKALNISQASVAQAKARGKIPSDWIITISYKYNISADWLLYGEETARQDTPTAEKPPARSKECSQCEELEIELKEERKERRELAKELREINAENRKLWKENGQLKAENSELRSQLELRDEPARAARKSA